jgi:two-component system response regulator YesN
MVTALLIDDEPLTTLALRKIIEDHFPAIEILGEMSNGLKAWELIQLKTPDIIISDIRMPHLDGLELMGKVREAALPIKVILVTAYGEFEYARKAIQLGASGYLLKPFIQTELIHAVFQLTLELENEIGHKNQLSKVIPLVEENALKKLLLGRIDSTDFQVFQAMVGDRWEYGMVSVFKLNSSPLTIDIDEIVKISITEEMNCHLLQSGFHGVSFFSKRDEFVIVYTPMADNTLFIQGCIQVLMKYIDEAFQYGSCTKEYTLNQLSEAYEEASRLAITTENNLFSSHTPNTSPGQQDLLIAKAVEYCKKYYVTDINLQKIADHLNINKDYFCKLFKEKHHINFWDYVTGLRIEHAKKLLESTEERASDIAIQCGYINSSHFGRIFKETVGVTPAEYRRRTRL